MKKLLLLFLAVAGMVGTASAWNDNMYLICKENSNWSTNSFTDQFKFKKIDDNHFRATVPGSYINNGNWNFRFRENNGGTNNWWNIGPIGSQETDNTEVTETAVQTNYNNSGNASFYIKQNANASFVQIFIEWEDPYWKVTASVITDKYTVAYSNHDEWETVKAYAHYYVDNCPKEEPLGSWSGSAMTYNSGSKVYTIDVPAIDGGKIIFTDGNGNQYPSEGGFDIVEDGVYGNNGQVTKVEPTIGSAGYSTFSSEFPVDFTGITDVTAYRAEQTSNNEVLLKKVSGKVPAATGLVLKGTAGATPSILTTITATSIGDNNLKASVKAKDITVESLTSDYYYFLAGTTDATIGFYRLPVGNFTSGAGKAYYQTNTPLAETTSSRASWIIEGEEAQGINTVESTQNADVIYDLQGRVAKTAKAGLYIKNGKKVVMK